MAARGDEFVEHASISGGESRHAGAAAGLAARALAGLAGRVGGEPQRHGHAVECVGEPDGGRALDIGTATRARLLGELRERVGVAEETATAADPANTHSPLLFHLAREFGAARPRLAEPDESLTLLRSAGTRGEAEAIAAASLRLTDPAPGGMGSLFKAMAITQPTLPPPPGFAHG